MPLATLPPNSRLVDPTLGAGALLDIGVYTLTYASVIMGAGKVGDDHPHPKVTSSLDIVNGIDHSNAVILDYEAKAGERVPTVGRTAVCTSTFHFKGAEDFARIEGSDGTITIFGIAASCPSGFRVKKAANGGVKKEQEQIIRFEQPLGTVGFVYEADAVAIDISNGRTENSVMPLDETLRMMRLMDGIRKDAGLVYPQDQC